MSEVLTESRRRELLENYLRTRVETAEPSMQIAPRSPEAAMPLTFAQQQLWLHAQLAPDTALYNEPLTVRHRGQLNIAVLERAFSEVVRRHEAWRTVFPSIGGEPVQRVLPPFEVVLPALDLRHLNPAEREQAAVKVAAADARLPFDLAAGPLFRAKLVSLADEEHRLYVTLHHLIFDGYSGYRVFLPELVVLYDAFLAGRPSPLPEVPFQFGDYAIWQRELIRDAALESHMQYWRKQLSGPLPSLHLPQAKAAPAIQSFAGAMHTVCLPRELSNALRGLSQREGTTLFMTLLAAFNALLFRYSGQEDILVGSNTAGRSQSGSEKLLGYFLNTIPLRTDLSGDPTFRELLDRVRGVSLGAFSHDAVPLDFLVAELQPKRDPNRNPLFQILFSLEPPLSQASPEWDLTCIEFETGFTKFELCMVLDDREDGLLCRLIYNTALFDGAAIRRMAGHWRTLLEAVAAEPGRKLSEYPLLTPAERNQLLVEWNATSAPYTPVPALGLIEEQARRNPDAIAATCGARKLTYGELARQAGALARTLREAGVGSNVPVALCLERSEEMLVGILAILKAGGAYVPLDPANPRLRLEAILADCRPKLLLTNKDSLGMALAANVPAVFLNSSFDANSGPSKEAKPAALDDLAYLIYTSGSAGTPKGVQVTHRNLAHSLHARLRYYRDSPERFLLLSSYAFDSSVAGIFHTLASGGTLVIPPADFRWEAEELTKIIFEHKITHTLAVPSLYGEMLDGNHVERLGSLRSVIVAGEACSRQLVNRHYEILPAASLFNEYGPTEATVWSTVFECEPGDSASTVPIGRPIANTRVYVLDRQGEPVPVGVPGELYVGGDGVALGYLNQPALTAQNFLPDPFAESAQARLYRTGDMVRYRESGDLEFLGRLDQQLKIRGLRVELDEIETLLSSYPAVREAAVVAAGSEAGNFRLIAFVVCREDEPASPVVLRAFLRSRLPGYMVPASFHLLETMPRTSHGKIDREQISQMTRSVPEPTGQTASPRDEYERRLLGIWKNVLKTSTDDIDQDFFELGGHSLLAAKLLNRIEKEFATSLSLAFVFQSPTIAQMAAALRTGQQSLRDRAIIPIQPHGPLPPLFWIRGGPRFRLLAEKLGNDRPFLGVDLPYADGIHLPSPYRVEDIAAYLIKAIREVQPKGPYFLGGLCVNAVIAYEVAQQLVKQGDSIQLLAMLDAHNHAYYKNPIQDGRYTARLKYHLVNLMRMDSTETLAYVKDRMDEARRKIERVTWRLTADRKGHADDQFRNTDSIIHPAFSSYEPKPYPGKIVLLQSSEWPQSPYFDFKLGWEGLVGSLEFHSVLCDHADMFDEPNVEGIAHTLRMCLGSADSRL